MNYGQNPCEFRISMIPVQVCVILGQVLDDLVWMFEYFEYLDWILDEYLHWILVWILSEYFWILWMIRILRKDPEKSTRRGIPPYTFPFFSTQECVPDSKLCGCLLHSLINVFIIFSELEWKSASTYSWFCRSPSRLGLGVHPPWI